MRTSPSARIELVEEYYFSGKLSQIAKMNASGAQVINMGIGNPDGMPPRQVMRRLTQSALDAGAHQYQPYGGIKDLRMAFASWYKRMYSVELDAENEVLPLMGSKEGIMHAAMAFLNAGDEVLVPNPGYLVYEACSRLAGAKIKYYQLLAENAWLPRPEEIRKMDLQKVKIIWLNNPNMPTGACYPVELLNELLNLCKENNILLISDAAYSLVGAKSSCSILSLDREKDISIELNSLSKSHNMAGWRIGVASGSQHHISCMKKFKNNMDSGMFRPLQEAAVEALFVSDQWYQSQRNLYQGRRDIVKLLLERLGCIMNEEQYGLFCWAQIPDGFEDAEIFSDHVLDKYRIFIVPGNIFGSNGRLHVRASLCCSEEDLAECLVRINSDSLVHSCEEDHTDNNWKW